MENLLDSMLLDVSKIWHALGETASFAHKVLKAIPSSGKSFVLLNVFFLIIIHQHLSSISDNFIYFIEFPKLFLVQFVHILAESLVVRIQKISGC